MSVCACCCVKPLTSSHSAPLQPHQPLRTARTVRRSESPPAACSPSAPPRPPCGRGSHPPPTRPRCCRPPHGSSSGPGPPAARPRRCARCCCCCSQTPRPPWGCPRRGCVQGGVCVCGGGLPQRRWAPCCCGPCCLACCWGPVGCQAFRRCSACRLG